VVNVVPATGLPVIVGAPVLTGGSVGTDSAGGAESGAAGLGEFVVAGVVPDVGFAGEKTPNVSVGPFVLVAA
jgi:hypothetical protein